MILFEIHIFRDGVWKVDSVFDDKDLAIYEAQRMEQTARFSAVRVIEEMYDEATERTRTRTVYRSTKVDRENLESSRRRAQAANFSVQRPRRRPPVKQGISTPLLVFNLLAIVVGGIAALLGLQHFWGRF